MTTDTVNQDATERVGGVEMHVGIAEPSAESSARWARRAEALAAWLLAEWQRERAARATLEAC